MEWNKIFNRATSAFNKLVGSDLISEDDSPADAVAKMENAELPTPDVSEISEDIGTRLGQVESFNQDLNSRLEALTTQVSGLQESLTSLIDETETLKGHTELITGLQSTCTNLSQEINKVKTSQSGKGVPAAPSSVAGVKGDETDEEKEKDIKMSLSDFTAGHQGRF